jgi:hypothetical protein
MGAGVNGATSRRKGNQAEVDVCKTLREAGWDAVTSRAARGGFQAGEDIVTNFPASIEVKNHVKMDLAGWWKQAVSQAGDKPAIVVHKRVGKASPEEWWVTMDMATLLRLIGKP